MPTDRVGEGPVTCKHGSGIPYRCLECEAEMGERQAGPSALDAKVSWIIGCECSGGGCVLPACPGLRERIAAALRASEAALADMTSTAESWEQEYNLERLRLATMTKEREEEMGKLRDSLGAARAAASVLKDERDHWKITADAHAKMLMSAQDIAGTHEDVDVLVARLMREKETARERGIASVVSVRCVRHFRVPPLNSNEAGGGECPICALIDENHEWAQWREKWTATVDTYASLLESSRAEATKAVKALGSALKIARPWIDGKATYEEWEAAVDTYFAAIRAPQPPEPETMEDKILRSRRITLPPEARPNDPPSSPSALDPKSMIPTSSDNCDTCQSEPTPVCARCGNMYHCGCAAPSSPPPPSEEPTRCGAEKVWRSSSANGGWIARSCGLFKGHIGRHWAFQAQPELHFDGDDRTVPSPSPTREEPR